MEGICKGGRLQILANQHENETMKEMKMYFMCIFIRDKIIYLQLYRNAKNCDRFDFFDTYDVKLIYFKYRVYHNFLHP